MSMLNRLVCAAGVGVVTWVGGQCLAQEVVLEDVHVNPEPTTASMIERKRSEPRTERTITKEGIERMGGLAQTSLYKAIDILPSVHFENIDAYGLTTNLLNNTGGVRIRGRQGITAGLLVEGIPVWGISSPGPRSDMFDLENIQNISLYPGAVPVNKSFGAANTAGVMETQLLRPSDEFGVTVRQGYGMFDMMRSYARVDSGTLKTGTRLFGSYSYTSVDKWRGAGESPIGRTHVAMGLAQDFGSRVKFELFGNYTEAVENNYRPLSYTQAQSLNQFRFFDYNTTLRNAAAQDVNYYGFNKQSFRGVSVIGKLIVETSSTSSITFRPYYWRETRNNFSGTGNLQIFQYPTASNTTGPGIQLGMNSDFQRYGGVLEYKTQVFDSTVLAGIWSEWYDHPLAIKGYRPDGGGGFAFDNWMVLTKNDGISQFHSPYLRVIKDIQRLHIDGGIRYLYMNEVGKDALVPTGVGDVSVDQAYDKNPAKDPAASYGRRIQGQILPNLGLSYDLTDRISLYANYGRQYARPRGFPSLMSLFNQNRNTFLNRGLTLDYIVGSMRLETADKFDLGFRYNGGKWYVAPVLFYNMVHHQMVNIFDANINQSVPTAGGEGRQYGGELEVGAQPLDNLSLYASGGYTRAELVEDLQTATGVFSPISGRQSPNVPRLTVKAGATYNLHGFSVSPIFRYVGARFGDALSTQQIAPYMTVDLNLMYSDPKVFQKFYMKDGFIMVSLLNLFDKKYIGVINSFDETVASGTSYFPAAPFTVALTVGAKF